MTSKPWNRRQPTRRQPKQPENVSESKPVSRPRFAHEQQSPDYPTSRKRFSGDEDLGRTRRGSREEPQGVPNVGTTIDRKNHSKGWVRHHVVTLILIGATCCVVLLAGIAVIQFRGEPAASGAVPPTTVVEVSESSTSVASDQPAQPIWDDLARSVVFISAASPCDWRGSGTLVLDGSYVLTNEHVSSDGRCDLTVGLTEDLSSAPSGELLAVVVARDVDIDLAVLRLLDASGNPIIPTGHRPVSMDYSQPPLGSRLTTLGYPALGTFDNGMTITFTSGDFSGIDYTYGEFYKTTAQMRGGVSGGAAFNEKGLFIGIPTAGFVDEDTGERVGINLIRPAKFAKPLFTAAQINSQSLSWDDGTNSNAGGTDLESSVPLPSNVNQSWRLEVLTLTNQERIKEGLEPLTMCPSLDNAAQMHAEAMKDQGFFEHENPFTGDDPSSRGDQAGYGPSVGENIAMGYQTPRQVVRGWMNSPGHRENILGDYLHLGVGILKGESSKYGRGDWFYWVQNFGVTGNC